MQTKIFLNEDEIPRQWYNLAADLPGTINPPLGQDGNPMDPETLAGIFPMNLLEQEYSTQRWIDIPEGVLDLLYRWRPSPLHRAIHLEKALGTPAKIFYKNESLSPAGSHKPNSAVAQAWYNREFGIKRLTTETGAGQWGASLSYACGILGMECKVFMVRVSYDQKPFRKILMETWGGDCVASPSMETAIGREILAEDPNSPGSLGIAISEAIEQALEDPRGNTRYALGSVMNHVLLHQTIIGLEAKAQLQKAGIDKIDTVIGCAGGGSNFAGLSFPFVQDKIHGKDMEIIPVEPASCPTLTGSSFCYDHGDIGQMTPLLPMHSLGHKFIPAPVHTGGLRYHGMAPLVSHAVEAGLMTPMAIKQVECYEAGLLFARTEGTLVAPETCHAIAAAIRSAKQAKEEGREKNIIFCLSGHGLMDMGGYEKFMAGEVEDIALSAQDVEESRRISLAGHPVPKAVVPTQPARGSGLL